MRHLSSIFSTYQQAILLIKKKRERKSKRKFKAYDIAMALWFKSTNLCKGEIFEFMLLLYIHDEYVCVCVVFEEKFIAFCVSG